MQGLKSKLKCGYISVTSFVIAGFVLSVAVQSHGKDVLDQLGRAVKLTHTPQRLVSLAPSITEIIFALGRQHLLKGVTRFSDYPLDAKKLPKVGSYVHLDLERIVALKPDICIAIKDGNPKAIIDRLESLGIPVYAIHPLNVAAVMKTIQDIGRLLGAGEKAHHLVENMQLRLQRVESIVSRTASRPGVFFQIGISPIVSVGTDTFIHELIVLAGGKNLAEGPVPYPRFSREQVLGLSPEILIVTSMARNAIFDKVKVEWSRWNNMPAVRNERIFMVNSDLFDRPTPRLIDGLELLVRLIHPSLLEEGR
ncbi:MAG TPA: cobalamin-binding protein [Deltaproteobacteria bacterium]|nr:cobalamin-binding protein [Deltaproteobacteria bacterium]